MRGHEGPQGKDDSLPQVVQRVDTQRVESIHAAGRPERRRPAPSRPCQQKSMGRAAFVGRNGAQKTRRPPLLGGRLL